MTTLIARQDYRRDHVTERANLIARLALNESDIPAWLALAALDTCMGRNPPRRHTMRRGEMFGMILESTTPPRPMGHYLRRIIDICAVDDAAHSHPTMMTPHHPDILEWCWVGLYREDET